jgi:hypothetical protein
MGIKTVETLTMPSDVDLREGGHSTEGQNRSRTIRGTMVDPMRGPKKPVRKTASVKREPAKATANKAKREKANSVLRGTPYNWMRGAEKDTRTDRKASDGDAHKVTTGKKPSRLRGTPVDRMRAAEKSAATRPSTKKSKTANKGRTRR